MEVLILHPGGLGDILLALPAVALLKEALPGARLTMAANLDHLAPILGRYVESARSLATLPLHSLYTDADLPEAEARFWLSFDRIISWTGASDAGFVRRMKALHSGATVAAWKPGPGEKRHVAQIFIDTLGEEIARGRSVVPVRLVLEAELSDRGKLWLSERAPAGGGLIALHPGAGSAAKRWHPERFLSLARHLASEGRTVLLIEGPAEPSLAREIGRMLSGRAVIAESLPLDLLAAVIARCHAFVGNDSGVAHLAAALGVPSLVLFGPTEPKHWAPPGAHVMVYRNSRGCRACAAEAGAPHTCLENIEVEDVVGGLLNVTI